MSIISRLNERFRKSEIAKRDSSSITENDSDLPLDHQLSFQRDFEEGWSYHDGHIYLNDEDIETTLDENSNDVKFQSAVSDAISEYRDLVWKRGNGHFPKFAVKADAVQEKILNNMKRIYDERTGGLRLSWGDGGYLLNNLNIRAIIAMYHVRPTEKARKFLNGLKAKLALILVNKNSSPHYERASKVVKTLYDEVDNAISQTPIDGRYLPAHNANNSC
jgi:hypothetical protein